MSSGSLWGGGGRSLLVVTGASRGIGRAVATEFAARASSGSVLLLLARSAAGLQDTAQAATAANPGVKVICKEVDLGGDLPRDLLSTTLKEAGCADPGDFGSAVAVHNAGSLGDVTRLAADMRDPGEWAAYLSLNVVSPATLTAQFLDLLAGRSARLFVVNMTSLAAVEPFPSMGFYCVGKAARQMYFRVLAAERTDIRVLNYSPGVVDTEMVQQVEGHAADVGVRSSFSSMRAEGKVISPAQTARTLADLLDKGDFVSGNRVDYYDLV